MMAHFFSRRDEMLVVIVTVKRSANVPGQLNPVKIEQRNSIIYQSESPHWQRRAHWQCAAHARTRPLYWRLSQ
jgi:hypothetical protein